MKTKLRMILNLLLLSLGMMTHFACTSNTPHQERVRALLEGYEWKLEAKRFQQLPENTDLELMAIIKDSKSQPAYYQFRALTALRLYPNTRVAHFFEQYLKQNEPPTRLRRALESYGIAFSSNFPEQVERISGNFLKHPDAHLRIAAARILKKMNRQTSRQLLEQYLTQETEKWIHQAIGEK
ncbi:MAG: HEAT repeat domain-containing protein [SAR324 cluster bacterium]|nr:HEAT repeat domain-containing protein [SAR324 cluster bacterium]